MNVKLKKQKWGRPGNKVMYLHVDHRVTFLSCITGFEYKADDPKTEEAWEFGLSIALMAETTYLL